MRTRSTILSPGNNFDKLADDYVVNPPRTVGVRVGYSF